MNDTKTLMIKCNGDYFEDILSLVEEYFDEKGILLDMQGLKKTCEEIISKMFEEGDLKCIVDLLSHLRLRVSIKTDLEVFKYDIWDKDFRKSAIIYNLLP